MSRSSARHRKPRHSPASDRLAPRHRKPSPVASALRNKPARVAAAAAGSALIVSAWPATAHLTAGGPHPAGPERTDALDFAGAAGHSGRSAGRGPTASLGPQVAQRPKGLIPGDAAASYAARHRKHAPAQHRAAPQPVYLNPFRDVSDLVPERIDMGADFSGAGPVYALGDAVITNATAGNAGWPGGGWITYQLTKGPGAGLMVYVAEDVTPTVRVGAHVSSSTVIATMFAGSDGIETGWAQPGALSAESQLPAAGGISGNGPFPTRIGLSFEKLLQSVGVPAGNNRGQAPYGLLPPEYPAA